MPPHQGSLACPHLGGCFQGGLCCHSLGREGRSSKAQEVDGQSRGRRGFPVKRRRAGMSARSRNPPPPPHTAALVGFLLPSSPPVSMQCPWPCQHFSKPSGFSSSSSLGESECLGSMLAVGWHSLSQANSCLPLLPPTER